MCGHDSSVLDVHDDVTRHVWLSSMRHCGPAPRVFGQHAFVFLVAGLTDITAGCATQACWAAARKSTWKQSAIAAKQRRTTIWSVDLPRDRRDQRDRKLHNVAAGHKVAQA